MKVCDLEVKNHAETNLVTVWDNACVYTHFEVGQVIRLTGVLSGYNKFHKRRNVIFRYEDQVQNIRKVPVEVRIDEQAFDKYKNYEEIKIVGKILTKNIGNCSMFNPPGLTACFRRIFFCQAIWESVMPLALCMHDREKSSVIPKRSH